MSSWVGVEIGYIAGAYASVGLPANNAFLLFLKSIPRRLFPILQIFFVLIVILLQKDFGPMATAEEDEGKQEIDENTQKPEGEEDPYFTDDAPTFNMQLIAKDAPSEPVRGETLFRNDNTELNVTNKTLLCTEVENPLHPKEGKPRRCLNATVPIVSVIVLTFLGMFLSGFYAVPSGMQRSVVNVFTFSDSLSALVWASAAGCIMIIILVLVQRILTLSEAMDAFIVGIYDVIGPILGSFLFVFLLFFSFLRQS